MFHYTGYFIKLCQKPFNFCNWATSFFTLEKSSGLTFDFLIPYEGKGNREYFFEDEENIEEEEEDNNNNKNEIIIENVINKNQKQKFEIFSINKDINFSLINKK